MSRAVFTSPFRIEAADWRDPDRLSARINGTVARFRDRLTHPATRDNAFRRLHRALTLEFAAAYLPDPGDMARGVLLLALHDAGISPPDQRQT
jgi:hypothetical protein